MHATVLACSILSILAEDCKMVTASHGKAVCQNKIKLVSFLFLYHEKQILFPPKQELP